MSITPSFLYCVASHLVSLVLFQSAKAGPTKHDRDRAVLAWNLDTDLCFKLPANADKEEKDAANWACAESFKGLDNIKANSCKGWRHPACRPVSGQVQCTCKILLSSEYARDVTKSFRECALDFWTDELFLGQVATSARFQTAARRIDDDLQASRDYRRNLYAGASVGAVPQGGSNLWQYGATSSSSSVIDEESGGPSSSSGTYVCEFCGYPYSSRNSYIQHVRTHTTPIATCTVCGKTLSTKSNLLAHMKSQHPEDHFVQSLMSKKVPDPAAKGKGGKIFECDVCKRTYASSQLLRDHKKSHTGILVCKICLKRFVSVASFEPHIKREHPGYEAVAKIISDEEALRMHIAAHPYACDGCGMRFSKERSLKQHVKSHLTMATTCIDCNRTYSTTSSYYVHMRNIHKMSAAQSKHRTR